MKGLIKNIWLVVLILFVIGNSGCEKIKAKDTSKVIDVENSEKILTIHGSNTIGAKLMPLLVKKWLLKKGAENVNEIAGATLEEKNITGKINKKNIKIEIHSYGSSTGFNDLVWDKCDIAMSSKPIPDEAVSKLSKLGDMRSSECEHILALDGIAIIVNNINSMENIDIKTLKRIFSGEITNWEDLGVTAGKINIYRRDNNSGTHEVFKKLVMSKSKLITNAFVCLDNNELSQKISMDPRGIGYTSVTFTGNNKSLKIKGEGDALFGASKFAVQTEDYPLSRRLFLYTPAQSQNSNVDNFVEFILSAKGQKEVEGAGFIAQTLRLEKPNLEENIPTVYQDNVRNALRLSMNFRFIPGSSRLDNRSLRDINRFVEFIENENLQNAKVKLFGFSDNQGNSYNNKILSYKRAKNVANILKTKTDIEVKDIKGFGALMPVASNNSYTGRMKNRRVEVWMDFSVEG